LLAFPVNFVASLPGAARALAAGRLHSRVIATSLIAAGGLVASLGTGLARFGEVRAFDLSLVAGLALIFAGFLASAETFADLRIPFTRRLLWHRAGR
jgi:sulfite exporter TauE/SafE